MVIINTYVLLVMSSGASNETIAAAFYRPDTHPKWRIGRVTTVKNKAPLQSISVQ